MQMIKNNKKLIIGVAIALAVVVLAIVLSTILGPQKLPVDSTVKVKFSGVDGYGVAYLEDEWDWVKDVDFKNKDVDDDLLELIEYSMIFEGDIEYSLSESEGLSNGDVIKLKISVDKEDLKRNGFKAKSITKKITVSGLEKVKEIDPFSEGTVNIPVYGLSGAGSVSNHSNHVTISLENGEILELELEIDSDKKNLSNGDKVHVKISDERTNEELAQSYGLVLSKREADVEIKNLSYYPVENPKEIFDCITEDDMNRVLEAVKTKYKNYAGDLKIEYVGAVYYYTDSIDFTKSNYDDNNKLIFIYHMDNGIFPNGWYTYMSFDKGVFIEYQVDEEGKFNKVTVAGTRNGAYDGFPTTPGNYGTDYRSFGWNTEKIITSFDYEGLYYEGHKTLEGCVNAFTYYEITNDTDIYGNIIDKGYNHVIATEKLKELVKEY